MRSELRKKMTEQEVESFNRACPVGTLVRYWRGVREGTGLTGQTKGPAFVLGGHTAVILIEGSGGVIAISHVEVIADESGN